MEKIVKILERINPNIDYGNTVDLIDSGLFDSFDIITLLSELTEEFNVVIDTAKIEPEYFNSAETIYNFVQSVLKA